MTRWVLFLHLIGGSGEWIPLDAFTTEQACEQALRSWTFDDPKWMGSCLPGVIEPEPKTKRTRKR